MLGVAAVLAVEGGRDAGLVDKKINPFAKEAPLTQAECTAIAEKDGPRVVRNYPECDTDITRAARTDLLMGAAAGDAEADAFYKAITRRREARNSLNVALPVLSARLCQKIWEWKASEAAMQQRIRSFRNTGVVVSADVIRPERELISNSLGELGSVLVKIHWLNAEPIACTDKLVRPLAMCVGLYRPAKMRKQDKQVDCADYADWINLYKEIVYDITTPPSVTESATTR